MRIFVTVGSTHFDSLIEAVDSDEFLETATRLGYTEIRAQIGNYQGPKLRNLKDVFSYAKPEEFSKNLMSADLVIGHAGAGTVMEVLKIGKPLLVVVNSELMHDHQIEVAQALADRGFVTMSRVTQLVETLARMDFKLHRVSMDVSALVSSIETHFGFAD